MTYEALQGRVLSPIQLLRWGWPDVIIYRQEEEILNSFWYNKETIVPAANKVGKDWTAGFACLGFFLTRYPCRLVNTSAKDDHLRVLWGEISRFVQTCRYPLDARSGGPLILNHQDIRRVYKGERCPISYMVGMVASEDSMAAMQGHHVTPRTLAEANDGIPRAAFAADESSSVPQSYFEMVETWAQSSLIFGNCWHCENKFKWSVKGRPGTDDRGGDILRDPADPSKGYIRRIIRIKAEDSPNVRLALAQQASGKTPTGEIIVPGVKSWEEYCDNRRRWDPSKQCVSLDADWYEGAEVMLFPAEWLNAAEGRAEELDLIYSRRMREPGKTRRRARAIGVDPAEGGDMTSMAAVDEHGLIELVSRRTPNTADVPREILAFARRHGVIDRMEDVVLDRGGGGKQHADRLREEGYEVRTVSFGGSVDDDPRYGGVSSDERLETKEERYAFFNRRAQLYGELSALLDPTSERPPFALPREFSEVRRQLSPIPKTFDEEGRLRLLSKHKKDGKDKRQCLSDLIGCSPDEADALVLAVHGMLHPATHALYIGVD